MFRLVLGLSLLASAAGAVSLGGKWLGHSIALAGYSDDTSIRRVVIGRNVIDVPANMIRHERARRNGVASRLDVFLRWPQMDGYSEAAKADFNNQSGGKRIVFLSFEPQMMSRDMSGRFELIYSKLIAGSGRAGGNGITFYDFKNTAAYAGERLAVADRAGQPPFVARCLAPPADEESLAPCERDVQIGDNLSLTYRFPLELLSDWAALDAAMHRKAAQFLHVPET